MVRTLLCAGVLAAAGAVAQAEVEISWVKGDKLCAGMIEDCSTIQECTGVALGPCDDAETGAPEFISTHFEGMGFVKEGAYLSGEEGTAELMSPQEETDARPNGYRNFDEVTDGDNKYAYTMVGMRFGDMADAGAYIGLASYFVTGSNTIETNSIGVKYSDADNTERVGDTGAPLEAEICISQITDGVCGAARKFVSDEYKFSVFGLLSGTNYPGSDLADSDFTHVGVRMRMDINNFEVTGALINGDKTLENIGYDDVTSLALKLEDDSWIGIDFPQYYNIGSGTTNIASKKIKIHISVVEDDEDDDAQAIYIDYLFDFGEGEGLDVAGNWFIYDPDVRVQPDATVTPKENADAPKTAVPTTTDETTGDADETTGDADATTTTGDAEGFDSPAAAAGLVAGLLAAAAAAEL